MAERINYDRVRPASSDDIKWASLNTQVKMLRAELGEVKRTDLPRLRDDLKEYRKEVREEVQQYRAETVKMHSDILDVLTARTRLSEKCMVLAGQIAQGAFHARREILAGCVLLVFLAMVYAGWTATDVRDLLKYVETVPYQEPPEGPTSPSNPLLEESDADAQ